MGQHVAFKCTYNNGGEGTFVGFRGICTDEIIKWNIENGRIWCGQNKCSRYYDRHFKGQRPDDPCLESVLFRDWKFGAGVYHNGERAGTPIHITRVDKGKIAILTTRFPGEPEIDRKIVGFFKIAHIKEDPGDGTILSAENNFRIRLPLEEAQNLYFWDYYSTKGGAKWGTLLFRYLNDDQVVGILKDIEKTLRNEKYKLLVNKLLNQDFSNINSHRPAGPRMQRSGDRLKRVLLNRKYGSGGEGEEHKRLKNWIAEHPEFIGLTNVVGKEIEYIFASGDIVDILFERDNGKFAVVEIETAFPSPGSYQALKYKVLKCAELRSDIKSPNVEAIIVAWSFPPEVKAFCRKYGIRCVEKKL